MVELKLCLKSWVIPCSGPAVVLQWWHPDTPDWDTQQHQDVWWHQDMVGSRHTTASQQAVGSGHVVALGHDGIIRTHGSITTGSWIRIDGWIGTHSGVRTCWPPLPFIWMRWCWSDVAGAEQLLGPSAKGCCETGNDGLRGWEGPSPNPHQGGGLGAAALQPFLQERGGQRVSPCTPQVLLPRGHG